jgi:hypothetical protein
MSLSEQAASFILTQSKGKSRKSKPDEQDRRRP